MRFPDLDAALASGADLYQALELQMGGIHPELYHALAPLLLVGIFLIHFVYYRRHMRTDGQQVVAIADFTGPGASRSEPGASPYSVFEGAGVELSASDERTSFCRLPFAADRGRARAGLRAQRHEISTRYSDQDVKDPLICGEDLAVDGTTLFHEPVKVGGDLTIGGEATFEHVVIVNGVLKVEGSAHFANGLVVKGDALVTGDLFIGSRDRRSWAVVRRLTIANRLRLNGRLVSEQDIQLMKAA
jgi:hypothetical protein